jgi:hypothetical protein
MGVRIDDPMECFGGDWRCNYPVERGMSTSCIAAICVDAVWGALEWLKQTLIDDEKVASRKASHVLRA